MWKFDWSPITAFRFVPIKLHFAFFCGGHSTILMFLPLIGREIGASPTLLGTLYLALPVTGTIFGIFTTTVSDKLRSHKPVLATIALINVITAVAISFLQKSQQYSPPPTLRHPNAVLQCSNSTLQQENHLTWFYSTSDTVLPEIAQRAFDAETGFTHRCNLRCNLERTQLHQETRCVLSEIRTNDSVFGSCVPVSESSDWFCDNLLEDNHLCNVSCNAEYNPERQIFSWNTDWWLPVAFVTIHTMFSTGNTLTDTITYGILGTKYRSTYGYQRLFGSIAWGILTFLNGHLLDLTNSGNAGPLDFSVVLYVSAAVVTLDAMVVLLLNFKPDKATDAMSHKLRILLSNPEIFIYIAAAFASGFMLGILNSFLLWYIRDLNGSGLLLGIICSTESISGAIIMLISPWIFHKISERRIITGVFLIYSLRFLIYSSIQNPWWAVSAQLFHGITFTLFYITVTRYASTIAPEGMAATTQNMVGGAYTYLGYPLGCVAGGLLKSFVGSRTTFWYMIFVCSGAAALYWMANVWLDFCQRHKNSSSSDNTVKCFPNGNAK